MAQPQFNCNGMKNVCYKWFTYVYLSKILQNICKLNPNRIEPKTYKQITMKAIDTMNLRFNVYKYIQAFLAYKKRQKP